MKTFFVRTFSEFGFWDFFVGVVVENPTKELMEFKSGPEEEMKHPSEFISKVFEEVKSISKTDDIFCLLFDAHGSIFSRAFGQFATDGTLRHEFFEYVRMLS